MMSRYDTVMKYFLEQKAENDKRTSENIEKYRKGNCELRFVFGDKVPSEATAVIRQKKHQFRFGANLFMLDEFEAEEKNRIYREKFPELFNLATLPFYWDTTEPQEGHFRFDKNCERIYRRPSIDLCMEYCKEHGIEPKCHCLNYDTLVPEWTKNLPTDVLKEKLENRFRQISERYSKDIPSFEVTNETLQVLHNTAFFMEDDYLDWSYLTADKYFKNNELIINDYNIWDPFEFNRNYYFMQIERLLGKGIKHLDTIGLQFHCFFPEDREWQHAKQKFNPERLYALLDLFAKLGKEEQITEMTIPARSNGEEDELVQADLTENLYRLFFSHPNMNGIIYWNLVDGYGYNAEPGDMTAGENIYYGGFLRFDMSEKPVYKKLKHLINEEWNTKQTLALKNGTASFRGFFGEYEAELYCDNKVKKFDFYLDKKQCSDFENKKILIAD